MMAAFALTNGYLGSLGMMFGPSNVEDIDREKAGFIMSTSLNLGIFMGSHLALAIQALQIL